jgi:hypothetical protein
MLREKGELMREMLNKIEADRDEWRRQAQTLALTPPKLAETTTPARRSWAWWRRGAHV